MFAKKIGAMVLVLCVLMMLPMIALGAPFLVCSPETVTLGTGQTLTYNVSGLPSGFSATNIPASTNKSYGFELDLATLAGGGVHRNGDRVPERSSARTGVHRSKRPFLLHANISASGSVFPGAFRNAVTTVTVQKKGK